MPGTLVDTKVTDANGNYNFSGLVPGDYITSSSSPPTARCSTRSTWATTRSTPTQVRTASPAATRSPRARPSTPSMRFLGNRLDGRARCGWTATPTACRTRAKWARPG
ncbi:MAG: hypothetical protein KF710_01825 [Rhodocyclaceae bacterium]|nr:hypothetical protein [Rhodocyclaceae bacterium]